MHVLLLDTNPDQPTSWAGRLRDAGATVTVVNDDADWADAEKINTYSMAICPLADNDTPPIVLSTLLREFSGYVVAIAGDHDPDQHRVAYEAGFDDCIDIDCNDRELAGKLSHAEHCLQVDERLAQSQKLGAIGELAAGIAHEINTPIQYVGDNTRFFREAYNDLHNVLDSCRMIVEALESGENPAADVVRLRELMNDADFEYLQTEIPSALGQTLDGIDRVVSIVRAMKEFAHPGTTQRVPVNLGDAIQNTITVARNEWKYVAKIDLELDSQLGDVPALPAELNQVLLNLIVNAAHAIAETKPDVSSGDQAGQGTISIRTRKEPDYAAIEVSDTGCGIEADLVEQIFQPFFTTKAAGKGTGQGLAIVHEVVVRKHQGTVAVESQPGSGTTFTIRLPLQVAEQEPEVAQSISVGGDQ